MLVVINSYQSYRQPIQKILSCLCYGKKEKSTFRSAVISPFTVLRKGEDDKRGVSPQGMGLHPVVISPVYYLKSSKVSLSSSIH